MDTIDLAIEMVVATDVIITTIITEKTVAIPEEVTEETILNTEISMILKFHKWTPIEPSLIMVICD